MLHTKINNKHVIILICFVLSSCLTNGNKNIDDYLKYNRRVYEHINDSSYKAIRFAKYTLDSENIIIHERKLIKEERKNFIYIYNIKEQTNKEIYTSLEFEFRNRIKNINFIDIMGYYILDEKNIVIFLSIYIMENNEPLLKQILFNYWNEIIINEQNLKWGRWFEKQSLSNRTIFFNGYDGNYYRQIVKIIDNEPKTIEVTNEIILKEKMINSTKSISDICDGIDEKTVFYSTLNINDPQNYWDDRNIIILYNWKENEVIEEISLPEYFHKYLKGNTIDINLSKDKKFMLFGYWPYGLWVYNLDNKTIYEICNTKYNWNWGFGRIQAAFCDWSWEGNKVLIYIVSTKGDDKMNGLYEVDLDKIDELNLKKIE